MPSIGFTVMKDKILSGEKRQTIRAVSKRKINPGDTLYLYWHLRQKDCELLKVTKCRYVLRQTYRNFAFDNEIARADGFKDAFELRLWFKKKHNPEMDDLFDIIGWE